MISNWKWFKFSTSWCTVDKYFIELADFGSKDVLEDAEKNKEILNRILTQLDVAPNQTKKVCELLHTGFRSVSIIDWLFRFRDHDSKEPAKGADEILTFIRENGERFGPDKISKMIAEVGFWNLSILSHQSKKGKFI